MQRPTVVDRPRFRAYGRRHIDRLPEMRHLSTEQRIALKTASTVLPFRVNQYVLRELIDWDDIPNDPIYQLTFPQAGMLERADFLRLEDLVVRGEEGERLHRLVRDIHVRMHPNPSGQKTLNVPRVDGERVLGCQHKYRETVLFFPVQGQTCHAYCTYCFRWAQFVGVKDFRFAARNVHDLVRYLTEHDEVTDVLVTGGDPMLMNAGLLRRTIEPLLDPALDHVQSIRIGTKSLSYWPYRYLSDRDADEVLRLFEEIGARGRQLAFMAHFSHPRESETREVERAVRRILDTGAVIRTQAPIMRHINDRPEIWTEMWRRQVALGAVPYYFFIERDTGPKQYFQVPLARAIRIFASAISEVSGLARTVRGPSMSATPGKVLVDGVATIQGDRVFVLKMVQARDPEWVNRVFFAHFDSQATWLDDLQPAFGGHQFFFEPYIRAMLEGQWEPEWARAGDEDEEMTA
ncbi:MAG: lysine 2,3-aminomutase [Acidobacteria bacterium]|jgi:L-lysine 2,3-aminomutase|nr:lysine 2,3-aminomutase [Acidobacteriota bacterium]